MKPELMDLYFLKTELWNIRNINLKNIRNNLDEVLKSLKNNKSMDPLGMVNELFKEGCIGTNLKKALRRLFNGVKIQELIPILMDLSNITTIYKKKGSRFDLNNDGGIFTLTVMKKILDKLIYVDSYSAIDENMSECNVGAKRKRKSKITY